MPRAKRIVIVGTSGSGKTTFAKQLAAILDYPRIELDNLYWKENWTPTDRAIFAEKVKSAIAREHWVLDGNYSYVREMIWARADMVIWLNYGFFTTLWRVVSRTIRRSLTREVLWQGNRESLLLSFFSRESIILWMLKTYWKRRREYPAYFRDPENRHLQVKILTKPHEADQLLQLFLSVSKSTISVDLG